MVKVLLYLWENFGLDTLQLGVILFFGWKILTNHFKHLREDVAEIKEKCEATAIIVGSLCERVSKIEGKLE